MLDLKNIKEEYITTQNILKCIDEYDIYAYYLGAFNVNSIFSSPFRKDNNASFGIFINAKGELIYNDYKLGGGNVWTFVGYMENCNFLQVLGILNNRYNLGYRISDKHKKYSSFINKPVVYNKLITPKQDIWIDIKLREWELHDKEYWSQYEISYSTLEFYNVFPISRFWLNNTVYNVDRYAYAYYYDARVFKIYQPYLDSKTGKWFSNIKDKDIYQGTNQLPDSGEILFITSSLKDIMVLYEIGYSAIAPHTEQQMLTESLFSHYSTKWNLMIVLYDNDDTGILRANKMKEKYGIKSIQLPESDTKDPSDFVKKYDLETLKLWIQQQI